MSFGPLNRAGGERRLNVLITRARQRCEVFTTLSADEIDLGRTNSGGVAALKIFLTYAATGKIDVPMQTQRPQDSVFEEQVLDALTRRGYSVHAQVGCAGFFLDLAVVDRERPGRYVLGIECDGAAYHNARSARDRDRLRQAVLEGLNWQIHRIWSTDWFRNPVGELNKVVDAIERASASPKQTRKPAAQKPPNAAIPGSTSGGPLPRSQVEPAITNRSVDTVMRYRAADLHINLYSTELHLVDLGQLSQWLAQVVAVESPVFWLEAARRVASAAGVQRLGIRIQDAFQRAYLAGSRAGRFSVRDGFLWRTDMIAPALRDRSDLPQAAKKIEYVAPEEIRVAIERVAQDSYGVDPDDVANGACRLLGFGRVTDELRTVIDTQRDALIAAGRLVLRGESLVLTDGPTSSEHGG
jgi:very-short-patch-repair endonuclease